MNEPEVVVRQIDADKTQHAIGDTRQPTRYVVTVDGAEIGEVYSHSSETRYEAQTTRFLGRVRGYTRSWRGTLTGNREPDVYASTRTKAVAALLDAASREM